MFASLIYTIMFVLFYPFFRIFKKRDFSKLNRAAFAVDFFFTFFVLFPLWIFVYAVIGGLLVYFSAN
jgi:hypothetical protein